MATRGTSVFLDVKLVEREVGDDAHLLRMYRREGIHGSLGSEERVSRAPANGCPQVVVECHHSAATKQSEGKHGIRQHIGGLVAAIYRNEICQKRYLRPRPPRRMVR